MATTKDSVELTTEDLRAKAKELGIKFTKNTSDDVLIEKIEKIENDAKRVANETTTFSKAYATRLQHVQISPLNPMELNQPAKFVSVANRFVTIRRAVQFNTPIFIEQCIVDALKEQKYFNLKSNTEKHSLGTEPEKVWAPAYNVVDLGTPTEEEWKNDPQWKKMRADKKLSDLANEGK